MAHESWSELYKCSDFIDYIVSRQQLPLATSMITNYIENNNLYDAPFKHIEADIQCSDSQIKQYIIKHVPNTLTAKAIFIDICALIEAAPITNNEYYMMSIQFTRITKFADLFSMKHRRQCMEYIISCGFEDGIHGLYTDLLEYDKNSNVNDSDVIDYLSDNSNDDIPICNKTTEVEQWLDFLKKAIVEYAYHAPIDAVVFIKELRIDLKRCNNNNYDYNLHILETYLLKHCGVGDDDKEEEQNTDKEEQQNTFEWLKNDIFNAVGNEGKISEIKQIVNDEEFIQQLFFYCNEICYIQSSDFRRLFIESEDNLNVFRLPNRIKCAQYIVTKYFSPAQARNDKNTLKNDLMRINMDDKVSDLIFDNNSDDDMKQNNNNKLFSRDEECEQFINSLFPIKTSTNTLPNNTKAKEYKQDTWEECECAELLKRCIKIKGTMSGKWMKNSVIMHSKLHPNLAFNLSVIDLRHVVYETVNNPSKRVDKQELSERFEKYLRRYHSEIDLGHLGQGLSDFVTNRYLPYIPVIWALLHIKLRADAGYCYPTQTALVEVSFRISDIMIAFKHLDMAKIIHVDLLLFYNQHKWKMAHELKKTFKYRVKNKHFYPDLFDQITQKILKSENAQNCVVRIFMLLNEKTPKIVFQFDKLNELQLMHMGKNDIGKKINNKKNPIYLPHVLEAWQRYQNLLLEKHENTVNTKKKCSFFEKCKKIPRNIKHRKEKPEIKDECTDSEENEVQYESPKCIDKIEYFQYSLIIFPQILDDDVSRIYTTKQLLCIGSGILPFKRKDIINLLPRMFVKRDNKRLSMAFIENMEHEYGNTGHRKQFFYDQKYDHIKELFDSLKMNKKK